MGRIRGISVILINHVKVGEDSFGIDVFEDRQIEVDNVLVGFPDTDDITNSLNLYGKKAVYTLAIPKTDTNSWEDSEVVFFGKRWRVFGNVLQGIESLIPLDWNKKVMVERYE